MFKIPLSPETQTNDFSQLLQSWRQHLHAVKLWQALQARLDQTGWEEAASLWSEINTAGLIPPAALESMVKSTAGILTLRPLGDLELEKPAVAVFRCEVLNIAVPDPAELYAGFSADTHSQILVLHNGIASAPPLVNENGQQNRLFLAADFITETGVHQGKLSFRVGKRQVVADEG